MGSLYNELNDAVTISLKNMASSQTAEGFTLTGRAQLGYSA